MSFGSQDVPRRVTPPRLARWLLARLLPPPNREYMLGDLDEEFAARVHQPEGLRGARRWYWRQVRTALTERRAPRHVERDGSIPGRATMLDTLRQDVLYAARSLRKQPGFTAVVVLTLALGIGANTAIFSLLDAVVLRAMPVERPEELALLGVQHEGGVDPSFNYPLFEDYRDKNEVFIGLVAYDLEAMHVTLGQESERILGMRVSWNYFDVLGARPVIGRAFLPEEDRVGAGAQVAVISYGFWEDRFEGKADAVGREILINGVKFTIVGVAPPRFTGNLLGQIFEIYTPITTPLDSLANPGEWEKHLQMRTFTWAMLFGRLKPGISLAQAQAGMRTLAEQIKTAQPMNTYTELVVSEGRKGNTGNVTDLTEPLELLQLIVALVLVIACANVANLQLTRALARRREVAVRMAMGAGGWRLMRQFLTESVLLAGAGGLAGLLVARWVADLLRSLHPDLRVNAGLDSRVLLFTLAVTLLVGLLFGLAPAWQLARTGVVEGLKEERARGGRGRLRQGLVVVQLGLSLVVLVAAGLTMKSLQRLLDIDTGFDADRVMVFGLDVSRSGYGEARGRQFQAELLEKVRGTAGVEAAGLSVVPPLTGGGMRITSVPEGRTYDEKHPINFTFNIVTPGFFQAMGIPLLRGRDFNHQDRSGAPLAAIVNEALVREYWPGHDGLGMTIDVGGQSGQATQVVGVVSDSKYRLVTEPIIPTMYLPMEQHYEGRMTMMVRSGQPSSLAAPVRTAVRSIDPMIPVTGMRTMAEQRMRSLSTPRMAATLLGMLGGLGLLLGTLGLYGVMAYLVTQRTHEIGIRMALGAERGNILRLVLRQALRLVVLGLALGTLGALAAARLIEGLLYGVQPQDPMTMAMVMLVLAGAALVACLLPARRAVRVDPITALRYE
jgi:predicted permease